MKKFIIISLFLTSMAYADNYIEKNPSAYTYKDIYDSLYWIKSTSQTGLTGDKSGSFTLITTATDNSFGDLKIPDMSLGTPTYSTINDFCNSFSSPGRKTGGVISDATGGYVAVTAGTGTIKASDDDNAQIMFFDWPAPSNIQIPSDSTRYIGVEYNTGTPQVVARTTFNWNLDSEFPLGRVISENINGAQKLYIYNSPWWVTDSITNTIEVIRSFGLVRRDESLGGLILSVTGTRNVAVTGGTLWSGLNEFSFAGLDTSSSGTFEYYWYKAGTGWQSSDATQYSVTQWNDVSQTTLQTIDANKYCNVWVYGEFDAGVPSVALIYPQAQYNTAAAAEATYTPTNLPTHIRDVGKLLGRIIIKQGVDAPISTQTVFADTFSSSVVTDHGNLSGLADDDHTQYLLSDGTRALAGNWSLGGYSLTSAGDITGTDVDLSLGTGDVSTSGIITGNSVIATTSLKAPSASSLTLGIAGEIGVNSTHKGFAWYDGTEEVFSPSIHLLQGNLGTADYDTDTHVWIEDLNADTFPHGIYVTKVYVDCNEADPTTELTGDLCYCDNVADGAFPGANPTVIVACDTTTGNFSNTTVNTVVASGKTVYFSFDADPVSDSTVFHLRVHYYVPES